MGKNDGSASGSSMWSSATSMTSIRLRSCSVSTIHSPSRRSATMRAYADSSKLASSNPIENAFMRPPAATAAVATIDESMPPDRKMPTGTSDTS